MEQSFTVELLLEIYDGFNRAARKTDDQIHPELKGINISIQSRRKAIKNFQTKNAHYKKYPSSVQRRHDLLKDNLRKKYLTKREIVTDIMLSLTAKIRARDFRIDFTKIHVKGKDAYSCGHDAASLYCLKAISTHLRKIYKIRPASRDYINHQISNYLSDGFPYRIIRADISNFFESIPHDELIKRLSDSGLLSFYSQSLIRRMLADYTMTGSGVPPNKGVPRGLSLSSDLAEFYMKPFDAKMQELPGVVFYSRYVDDILIIAAPDNVTESYDWFAKLRAACSEQGLTLNNAANKTLNTIWSGKPPSLTYLGFEHKFRNGGVLTDLSFERSKKYRNRIDKCFDAYYKRGTVKEREAGKWLERRLKFLTTNTRLEFSKELAHTGIYFNNTILNDTSGRLKALDHYLNHRINVLLGKAPHRNKLCTKLRKLSFEKGFNDRAYSIYTSSKGRQRAKMLKKITDIWQYD